MEKINKLVPDTSVIIEGLVSAKIKNKELEVEQVIIHEAVLAELEHQANVGRSIGFLGLDEIQRLRQLNVELRFSGIRPKAVEIKHASLGEIDALIRQLAFDEDATLLTSDKVQNKVAEARGMRSIYIEPKIKSKKLKIEKFFDDTTMSVHLRENVMPYAKRGMPGKWDFIALRKQLLSQDEIQDFSREIIEESKLRKDGFIEIERTGSTIAQLGNYRIVITRPPFSDGWEITAVRPVKKLVLDDYKLSEKLMGRIIEQAEGILVAGSPGMGKSTFAQALAEFYASKDKIVKTVEAPRDLVLPENVTQYAISHGDAQEIHDILLLSRPDYTVFDEMRNTDDFRLFADLRLAGVGMIGVVHATNPVDAIQRFLGRVEMGIIPQIIDTVVFIKNGFVNKVLSLKITVKVPSGMTEADLARPVVIVNDFETGKLEYEIYTYGEQTVVIPVIKEEKSGAHRLAAESIEREFRKFVSKVKVDVVSANKCIVYIPENEIGRVIGKQGKTIEGIENKLGISIDVHEYQDDEKVRSGKSVEFETKITKKAVLFYLDTSMSNKDVDIYLGEDYLMTAKTGKSGILKISRKNKIGNLIVDELNNKGQVRLSRTTGQ